MIGCTSKDITTLLQLNSGNAATLFYEADLFIKSNLKQFGFVEFDFDNGSSDKLVDAIVA